MQNTKLVSLLRNYASGGELSFQTTTLQMLVETMVLGNAESLNYADNDGAWDHS